MKCPHCKKEHPEDTIFCPFEGKRITPLSQLSCPNPDCSNYGKMTLPSNYRYCPLCNSELQANEQEHGDINAEGDCDIDILSFGPTRHRVAQAILSFLKPAPGVSITLDDVWNSRTFSGLSKDEAFELKALLERAGAEVQMKHFHYYVCDKCSATNRRETKPSKCSRCRSRQATFTCIDRKDVTFCPNCQSYKMNYEDGYYHCANCGSFLTKEEVLEYKDNRNCSSYDISSHFQKESI
jgi:ribosomal protein L40E